MQRLADNGLTYSQWHTTALCSPTPHPARERLDGDRAAQRRLEHVLGREEPQHAVDAWTMGSSKKDWPLGLGNDRFYGFIGGETNQWYPDLAEGDSVRPWDPLSDEGSPNGSVNENKFLFHGGNQMG
jgi:arylsulfatase A-like enzyme